MEKPKTLKIDDVEYVRKADIKPNTQERPTTKQIVVMNRGWVVIGDVEKVGEEFHIHNASTIRYWGTTKGLGELRTGATPKTKLDPIGSIQAHELTIVFRMNVEVDKWN